MKKNSSLTTFLILGAAAIFSGCALLEPLEETNEVRLSSPTEHYNKALWFYQRKDYQKAQALFHDFLRQYPESPLYKVVLYYLGHCYQVQGDKKEALTIYNRIITTYDDDFWGEQALKRIQQIEGTEK